MADQGEGDAEPVDRLDFGDGPDPLSAEPGELESTPTNATQTDSTAETTADDGVAASLGQDDPQSTETVQSTDQTQSPDPQSTAQSDQPQAVVESTPESESEAETFDAFEGSPFESAGPVDEDDISAQIAALTEKVDQQERQLARQAELIETLIEELRRGR